MRDRRAFANRSRNGPSSRKRDAPLGWAEYSFVSLVLFFFSEGARQALVELVIISPALALIDLDKASVNLLLTLENLMGVLVDVTNMLYIELEIVFWSIIQVTWFSNKISRHLICDKLLSAIEHWESRVGSQTLPLYEFDQIELASHGWIRLQQHLFVPCISTATKHCSKETLLLYFGCMHEVPTHVIRQTLFNFFSPARRLISHLEFLLSCCWSLNFILELFHLAFTLGKTEDVWK